MNSDPQRHSAEKDAGVAAEWREEIGVRVMHAMTCLHADADFGHGAVCFVCFNNTQRIGALIKSEVERARATESARWERALVAGYPSPNCELRYDGTEDPVMAAYVDAWREVSQILDQTRVTPPGKCTKEAMP